MIPVTDEMVEALFERASGGEFAYDADVRHGIAAILAIVERDHLRPASGPDRCSACGRTARNLTPVTELVDGQPTVVQRLGPSCYQRAMAASARGRQTLPIGGDQ